jgi:hypothetical protein
MFFLHFQEAKGTVSTNHIAKDFSLCTELDFDMQNDTHECFIKLCEILILCEVSEFETTFKGTTAPSITLHITFCIINCFLTLGVSVGTGVMSDWIECMKCREIRPLANDDWYPALHLPKDGAPTSVVC